MKSNPILLITGANTGLGLETVKSIYQSSIAYNILLGGRSIDKANSAAEMVRKAFPQSVSEIKTLQLDIEDDNSISEAFKHIESQYGRLDVLINNAGASFDHLVSSGQMTVREMWNKAWDVNTTGTYILTHTLVPLILKSSDPRLIFITSGTSTLAESGNTSLFINKSPEKGWPKGGFSIAAYRSSKTGMNMMIREWTRLLKEDGVKVLGVSPGFLATGLGAGQEMNKKMGAEDPVLGANFIRDVVQGAQDQNVGQIVRRSGIQPW